MTCERKRVYTGRESALCAWQEIHGSNPRFNAYPCECGGWHIGHTPGCNEGRNMEPFMEFETMGAHRARVMEYAMQPVASLRSKLAARLPVLKEHATPQVHQPVMVRRPDGEWVTL